MFEHDNVRDEHFIMSSKTEAIHFFYCAFKKTYTQRVREIRHWMHPQDIVCEWIVLGNIEISNNHKNVICFFFYFKCFWHVVFRSTILFLPSSTFIVQRTHCVYWTQWILHFIHNGDVYSRSLIAMIKLVFYIEYFHSINFVLLLCAVLLRSVCVKALGILDVYLFCLLAQIQKRACYDGIQMVFDYYLFIFCSLRLIWN